MPFEHEFLCVQSASEHRGVLAGDDVGRHIGGFSRSRFSVRKLKPHLPNVELESTVHGVLFRHETSMSNGNYFRVALDESLLKASGQLLDLRLISGLDASFIIALELSQLVSFQDDTDIG